MSLHLSTLSRTLPLLAVIAGCDRPGAADVSEPSGEDASRSFCDGAACIDITPASGYTAASNGSVVSIKQGADVVARYDIDGSAMPGGSWVAAEWIAVNCDAETVGQMATRAGTDVLVVNDHSAMLVDGANAAAILSAASEYHVGPNEAE